MRPALNPNPCNGRPSVFVRDDGNSTIASAFGLRASLVPSAAARVYEGDEGDEAERNRVFAPWDDLGTSQRPLYGLKVRRKRRDEVS
jgi:hypothetical protein